MSRPHQSSDPRLDTAAALGAYRGLAALELEPLGSGLINDTFLLRGPEGPVVVQRVSPIFDPLIHETILAVTRALDRAGLPTPRLVPTDRGELHATSPAGRPVRVMTFVDGATFDAVESPAQARSAGALLARFHRAIEGLGPEIRGARLGVHDTDRHLARLEEALARGAGHRLAAEVRPLGEEILARAAVLPRLPELAERPCHGDPKLNNVRFRGPAGPDAEAAVCMLDLDTVAPMRLAHELGDAWRSWCNRAGEDRTEAALDLEVFRASLEGYGEGLGRGLAVDDRRALLLGPEWVSLEVAARFAADALVESYFGWDPARFAGRGEHNLVRARGQWSLHEAFVASRAERAEALAVRPPGASVSRSGCRGAG